MSVGLAVFEIGFGIEPKYSFRGFTIYEFTALRITGKRGVQRVSRVSVSQYTSEVRSEK